MADPIHFVATPRQSYLRSALYHDFFSQAIAPGLIGAHPPSLLSYQRFISESPNKLVAAIPTRQETESSQTAFEQNAPKFM
jgi:hypothetical protein